MNLRLYLATRKYKYLKAPGYIFIFLLIFVFFKNSAHADGSVNFIALGEDIPNAKFIWIGVSPFGVWNGGVNMINTRMKKQPRLYT
jgi:hypothetical protein